MLLLIKKNISTWADQQSTTGLIPKPGRKRLKKDKEINARPEQKAKRRELGRKNYETDKKKGKGWRKGKDCSHTKNGLRYKSVKANRGSKSDTKGDKNARGDSK